MTFMEGKDFNAAKTKWHEVSSYPATVANRLTNRPAVIQSFVPTLQANWMLYVSLFRLGR